MKVGENPKMPYPQCGRSPKTYARGNNDAQAKLSHCVHTTHPGAEILTQEYLFGSTAKQQSPHENNEIAFNLELHCPYEQTFFLSNRPGHNVPWATVGQVQCRVQISAKPGCAYGLQLTTAPPWFPVGVVVIMSLVFPTRLDPSAFCGVSAKAAMGLPTRWGPTVLVAVSV